MLEGYDNRSAYIEELILRDYQRYDDPSTFRKTIRLREAIEEATQTRDLEEARLVYLQKELDDLVSEAGNRKELKQPDIDAEREKVLGSFKERRASEKDIRGWFESRDDKRMDCGFSSPKEAAEWFKNKIAG